MYRNFGIWLLVGTVAVLVLPSSAAEAQRDAGAKLRGETGRYSGRPSGATPRTVSPQPSYSARPGFAIQPGTTVVQPQPSPEPYEAYSVQPLPFSVGDDVAVVSESARLMRGRRTLGTVPGGQQLRVLRIRGPWIGVVTNVDGREVGGWLWYSQVALADSDR